jgi:hypothetical protein
MAQNAFDQLAKQYLEEFLAPLGRVERSLEIPGEAKFVDVCFTPNASATNQLDLGLLNRIASTPCRLEPFRNSPDRDEVRSCLLKLLWYQEDIQRRFHPPENNLPRLWILASTFSKPMRADCMGIRNQDWPPGIYFMANILKAVIVAIDELPETEETLWLRILGKGSVQQQAITEVLALPAHDPRRNPTLQMLMTWKVMIDLSNSWDDETQEVQMALSQVYLEWEQRTEQRVKASLILTLLEARFGEISTELKAQVEAQSAERLDALAIALLNFTHITDIKQWLTK